MTLLRTNKNYRLLFSASAVSNLGDGVSALALPWLASLITRDPMLIATVAFATRLPWFICSIPAGVITDRYDRKHLMVGADILRMILTAGLVVCALTIPQPAPAGAAFAAILIVSGLAFLLGLAEVVRDNAAQTVLPSVVAKSDLERANGQLWSIEQIMGAFIGPPLAGFMIAWAVPAPFVLDTLSFALTAGLSENSCRVRAPKRFALRASGLGCEQCAAGACAFCTGRGTGAVFGNVCGTVVECGDGVVPPAHYSRCAAGAGQQHIPFFRVGFAAVWGAGIRCDCGHGRTGPRPGVGVENAIYHRGARVFCNVGLWDDLAAY